MSCYLFNSNHKTQFKYVFGDWVEPLNCRYIRKTMSSLPCCAVAHWSLVASLDSVCCCFKFWPLVPGLVCSHPASFLFCFMPYRPIFLLVHVFMFPFSCVADTVDSSYCKIFAADSAVPFLSEPVSGCWFFLSIRSCVSLHLHILDTCHQMLDNVNAVQLVVKSAVPLNCAELCPGMEENCCTLCYLNSSETCF